jgi:uncharacterized protein (TIGR03382 family)
MSGFGQRVWRCLPAAALSALVAVTALLAGARAARDGSATAADAGAGRGEHADAMRRTAAPLAPTPDSAPPPSAANVDVGAVMAQVHFAFRPEAGGFRGGHTTYEVEVDGGELAFTPWHTPREGAAVRGETVRLGSARISRGGLPLSGLETLAATNARAQLELVKDGIVERLANGPEGVEQTWTFGTPPAGHGPLEVRIPLRGGAVVAETGAGVHLAAGALGVRYGHGTWIDARGRRSEVPARVEAGEIVLAVAAATVDGAAYPAVLDPVISPELSVNDPVGVTSASQEGPALDWDGASYLVVWSDRLGPTSAQIVGARVDAAGALQDAAGFVISSGARSFNPAVAWNGSTHLVVWEQMLPAGGYQIHGARLGADGTVLDPIVVCTTSSFAQSPAVSWNGTNHLVVWADWGPAAIRGARVTAGGTVLDPAAVTIGGTASAAAQYPAVAPSGSNHLVVWMDGRNYDTARQDIYGARVTSDGTVLDASGIPISAGSAWEEFPVVSWDGTSNLVAWVDGRTSTWGLYGARVTTDGVVQDPSGILISGGRGAIASRLATTSDGTGHLVAWAARGTGGGADLYAARLSRAGAVVEPGGHLVAGAAQDELWPTLASSGPRSYLVAYTRTEPAAGTYRVHARTLTFDGAPVARDAAISTSGGSIPISLVAIDPDDRPLSFTVLGGPDHGTVTGTPPDLIYTPAAGYHGRDALAFEASNGIEVSNVASVSIAVNHAPIAQGATVTVPEDVPTPITLDATDADGDPLAFTTVTRPAHGTLAGTPPNLTYVPAALYTGSDAFTFRVSDGMETSSVATVSITVYPANHPPVAQDLAFTTREDEATAVVLRATDLDGDWLTYAIVSGPAHGALYSRPPELVYVPSLDFFGVDTFTYTANDGTVASAVATVTITVTPRNDPPVAQPAYVGVLEDAPTPITLAATDADGDPLTFATVTVPAHGTLAGTPPDLTYLPFPDYNGPDAFTFRANDGTLDSAVATISITVLPVNDAPVAQGATLTIAEDGTLPITLAATDVDGGPLTFAIVTGPAHGELRGTPPDLTYVPAPNYHGPDAFTFRARDGALASTATVSITVTSVNDDPVAIAGSTTVAAGVPATVPLSAADADGDPLTYTILSGPAHGTLSGTPPASIYTAAAGYLGPDAFTFQVSDGAGGTATATVSITVASEAPAPQPPNSPSGCGCTSGTGAEPILGALALLLLRRRRAAPRS